MKLLILGHARHGKDTFAEMVSSLTGLKSVSSSLFAAEKIRDRLEFMLDKRYSSLEEMYEDRVNHRRIWKYLISEYNTPNKARLCLEMLQESDIYVGMRCDKEYEATLGLFDLTVWVDAAHRVPEIDRSMKIKYDEGRMYYVSNSGSQRNLFERARRLSEAICGYYNSQNQKRV